MERLTEHSKQTSHENGICCTHFCGPECLEVDGNCAMNCKWEEAAWSRLAAYEDTGLTSQEVISMHGEWRAMMSVLNSIGGGYTRLRELAEADKDGRLVVLPFSDADDVEMQMDGITYKSDHWNILLTAFADNGLTLSGRKLGIFSVEEAEKALEAIKDE